MLRLAVSAARPQLTASRPAAVRARVFCSAKSVDKHADISLALGLLAGGVAGVISALSGLGGGMLLIPAVAKMTTMPMQMVSATCLAALSTSACVGAYNYSEVGACNIPLALATSLPAVLFTRVGVSIAQHVSSKRLGSLVGMLMVASTPLIMLRSQEFRNSLPEWLWTPSDMACDAPRNTLDLQYYTAGRSETRSAAECARHFYEAAQQDPYEFLRANLKYAGVGAAAGLFSGLAGIGGGLLTMTYLSTTTDMSQQAVIGTTLFSVLPMAASTNYFNYKARVIHFPTALTIGSSLIVGVYATSKFVLERNTPEEWLRGLFAVLVGVSGVAIMRRPI